MKNQQLSFQLQQIRSLIQRTNEATGGNIELQGHWGKYLCVLAAGFLENAISALYIDFVDQASGKPVANFASDHLRKIQNPKSIRFVETARAFKEEWAKELENFFEQNKDKKDAIDSIMSNRHKIAHGKNTSVSVSNVKEYLEKSVEVIEFIEKQLSK